MSTAITQKDLNRRMDQVLDEARRDGPVIVESGGEEQVAILGVLDYRLLRAVAAYQALPAHPAPASEPSMAPRGLDCATVDRAVASADGDAQAAWNKVIVAYLDADVSLSRAAALLGLPRFELLARFQRLGLPLRVGPLTAEEARSDLSVLS
ncbi:MAG: type II toxin-antitoxin system prevent-host-death family antitoxin [Candidatus Latescibacterota bacterium]